ncbi:MAG: transcription termination factor Rho, partial [Actinotalea sp.]|nr:transcription termination factor Rho [Actinotalea sp.]
MSDTIEAVPATAVTAGTDSTSRSGALSTLRLPELQALAAELGVPKTSAMRKSDLLSAIREHRSGPSASAAPAGQTAPAAAPTASSDAPRTATRRRGAPATDVTDEAPAAPQVDGDQEQDDRAEAPQRRPSRADRSDRADRAGETADER